jgi:hypothetical protein
MKSGYFHLTPSWIRGDPCECLSQWLRGHGVAPWSCIDRSSSQANTHSEHNRSGMGGLRNLCRRKRFGPPAMGVLSTDDGASSHPGLRKT